MSPSSRQVAAHSLAFDAGGPAVPQNFSTLLLIAAHTGCWLCCLPGFDQHPSKRWLPRGTPGVAAATVPHEAVFLASQTSSTGVRGLWRTLHRQGVSNNVEPHAAVYDRQSIGDLSISFSALYVRCTLASADQLAGSDRLLCRWVVQPNIYGQHPVAAQAFAATVAPCIHAASPYHLRPSESRSFCVTS